MFKKLTYVLMLILLGMGVAFGQTTHNMSETWRTSDGLASLVTIDKNLLQYKAENTLGTVNIIINGTPYNSFETAVAAITEQFETSTTTNFPTSDVTGTTVVNLSSTTATLRANRTINSNGTLVVVGSGKLTANASGIITVSGSLILQGDVVLDGGGSNTRNKAFIQVNGGKLYMAENATIQNCVNNYNGWEGGQSVPGSSARKNFGGAVYVSGNGAQLNMAGGVIGDASDDVRMNAVTLCSNPDYQVYETSCARVYTLTSPTGNKAPVGGGVFMYTGDNNGGDYITANLNGGIIKGNQSTKGGNGAHCGGGGLMAWGANATVNIHEETEISYNLSTAGAGVNMAYTSTLNIDGGLFKWNCAALDLVEENGRNMGGGVRVTSGKKLSITGGEFTENRSPNCGTALYIFGDAKIDISGVDIHHNYGCGYGAIYVEAAAANILSGKIYDNVASWGGAVVCSGTTAPGYGTDYSVVIGNNDGTGPEIYNNKVLYNLKPWFGEYGGIGGAIYLYELNLEVKGGHIYNNEAEIGGGFAFIDEATCTLSGGNIGIKPDNTVMGNKVTGLDALATDDPREINGDGGAIYVCGGSTGKTTIGGTVNIAGNTAVRNGGGLYIYSGEVDITGGTFDGNKALGTAVAMNGSTGGNGGGMYVASTIETDMTGGTLINNVAANNGGGLYLKGAFDMDGGSFGTSASNGNIATAHDGGGVYVESGNLDVSNGTFSGNKAEAGNGGGFYVASGNVRLVKGSGTGNAISINNENEAQNGGGFFVNGGTITITGAEISGNKATVNGENSGNGGGVYSNGGVLTINNGEVHQNTATNGGGFFVNGGDLKLKGGFIGKSGNPNTATTGGGFYIQGGSATIEGGTVQYNTATNGAGLYMKGTDGTTGKAVAEFSDGTFSQNTASSAGGGIYIDDYAELTMKGNSQITYNTVDAGGAGAGVYKRGQTNSLVMVSGSGSSSSAEVKIYENTINGLPNNLYLDQYDDYLTIDADGGLPEKMQLGVSVNTAGPKPLPTRVIRCTNFDILNGVFTKLMEAYNENNPSKDDDGSFIYDDAERFLPVFASAPDPFTFEYIFFAEVWPSPYPEIPEDFNPGNISTPDELTYFMMKVNGIRCEKNAAIDGNVVADIDMSGRFWIPIGGYQATPEDEKLPYSGTFHGNGHTISGLESIGLTGTSIYGLFGDTQGATIENVNLADCNMTSGQADYFGLLVGKMTGGQVLNCNVSGTLDASGSGDGKSHEDQNDGGFIGGLVGGTFGDEVHIKNVISTVDIVAEFHKDNEGDYDNDKYIEDSRTVGGLVGITSAGTVIENGFANPKIEHGSWFPRYVGGLVGYNDGTLTNCYVRLGRGVTLNIGPGIEEFTYNNETYTYDGTEIKSKFGMLAGYNDATTGRISFCYYPDESIRTITYAAHSATPGITYQGTVSENCKMYHPVVRPYTYGDYLIDNQVDNGTAEATTLLSTLNGWVETNGATYSHWMRTEGSDVNDDYPVLSYDNLDGTLDYTTVGSKDGVRLEYDNSFNGMYERFEPGKQGCLFIYKTPGETITANNLDSDNHISIYVEEDVALLQSGEERTLKNVSTCQVLKTQDGAQCWHTVASSLTGSKIGFDYGTETQVTWNEDTNPCNVTLAGSANSIFPTGTPIESLDLYSFYEPQYHWVNLKRNQQSHWHMNSHETPIQYYYGDEEGAHPWSDYTANYFDDNNKYDGTSTLVSGKGYLASIDKDMLIQGDGMLTNGEVAVPVTVCAGDFNAPAIPANEGTELKGYNLLGNPYQSYLSFAVFATENSALWSGTPSYAVYDAATGAYKQGSTSTTSKGSFAATGDINMHQGFFIVADNAGTATFDNTMRSDKPEGETHFRGEAPAYPLVNLVVTDATGTGDVAVVEFDRPEYNSAIKMKNIGADGKIYFHHNGGDQALLFLDEPTDHLPVHFEAIADGSYTMTWSTANADFSYLHLIDNVAGMDIDMLTSESYTFTATTDDYKSRFKLMFAYTGIDENEDIELAEVFAFVHDGNLIVNGEGMLEVIDMCGRCIVNTELTDAQNTVSLPQTASGLYVLRLINDNKSKVQKIVVR